MDDRQISAQHQPPVRSLIVVMAGVVAVTPLGLALAVSSEYSNGRLIAASIVWLIVVGSYCGLNHAEQRWQRRVLRQEIADARRARIETTNAYQDKLVDQQAILNRILSISGGILDEGIIDPQLTINKVQLIRSHARDADTQIDDAIIEAQVAIGAEEAAIEAVDLRDEIEEIAAPFARRGASISTAGPSNFGTTDPAMFRLIVRSFIAGAIDREAADIAVAVARNNDEIVCTVSDDGRDCHRVGLGAVSALAQSLASAIGASLDYSGALGRNQYSIAVPSSAPPQSNPPTVPMDVLGELSPTGPTVERPADPKPTLGRQDLVTFAEERERDRSESVAARKENHVVAR